MNLLTDFKPAELMFLKLHDLKQYCLETPGKFFVAVFPSTIKRVGGPNRRYFRVAKQTSEIKLPGPPVGRGQYLREQLWCWLQILHPRSQHQPESDSGFSI